MHERMNMDNLKRLVPGDEIKFVLSSRRDYDWAVETIESHRLDTHSAARHRGDAPGILFSPATDRLAPALLAQWLLEDELPVRLQCQLHKILWPDRTRGV